MFIVIVFAILAVTALIGTALEIVRDGYRQVPTRGV